MLLAGPSRPVRVLKVKSSLNLGSKVFLLTGVLKLVQTAGLLMKLGFAGFKRSLFLLLRCVRKECIGFCTRRPQKLFNPEV
jgi:hypothetical protein